MSYLVIDPLDNSVFLNENKKAFTIEKFDAEHITNFLTELYKETAISITSLSLNAEILEFSATLKFEDEDGFFDENYKVVPV